MKQFAQEELHEVLKKHEMWLEEKERGRWSRTHLVYQMKFKDGA